MIDRTLPERLFELISGGDLDGVEKLLHPDFVSHGPAGQQLDAAGMRDLITGFRSGFPDLHVAALDVVVEGDRCAWRVDGTGTHAGEFLGVPASGRQVRFTGVDLAVVRHDAFLVHWSGEDLAGVLMQIGAIPVPTPA